MKIRRINVVNNKEIIKDSKINSSLHKPYAYQIFLKTFLDVFKTWCIM